MVTGLLALASCGDDDSSGSKAAPSASDSPATEKSAARKDHVAMRSPSGPTIVAGDSEFGSMLFDSNEQAVYIFENDPEGKTVCYDECAEEWPPVITEGKAKAGKGVKSSLLGTVRRRDGKLQVTYAGKPLYHYAHEEPAQVLCHNVDLNGGLWWVVGPDGKRRL